MTLHYHVWHHPTLNGAAPFATSDLNVPTLAPGGFERKRFQSLKNDMAKLRSDGAAKGICDSGVVDVGSSPTGMQLWALKLGKGTQHKVLFTGCHHAREWISVEVPFLVAKYLVDHYKDPPTTPQERRIAHLLNNRQIWFVPMVNPEGHMHTVTSDRLWRKNRRIHALPGQTIVARRLRSPRTRRITIATDAYAGVDLNRNYPTTTWGLETFSQGRPTTSRDPMDNVWAGPSAGSEPETTLIVNLMHAQHFRSSITYHSFSQLLLYPSAARSNAFVQEIGRGMASLINAHGNPYTYQSGDALYPTTGDSMEFAWEDAPGRPTFTPELRPLHNAPPDRHFSGLPESEIEPTFHENLGAALALINSAGFDATPTRTRTRARGGVVQVVRNAWTVFQGWTP